MINFKSIVHAFMLAKNYSEKDEQYENFSIERRIAARLSRGNVSLQLGRYYTENEIKQKLAKVTSHRFV